MQLVILDATTKTIKGKLVGTASTQPSFVVAWADSTETNVTEGSTDGAFNSTTDVTIVAAPAASTRRIVKDICIHNLDSVVQEFIIKFDNNGTERVIWKGTIAADAVWYLSRVLSAGGAQIIDDGSVTLAMMENRAQNTIIGRKTASTGVPEELAASDVRTIINVADGATANTKATGAEVDTGTDDAKFVTAKAIADQTVLLKKTGGTMGGNIIQGENSALQLDTVLSADEKYCGITEVGTMGYAATAGDLVYLQTADTKWEKAKADAAATSSLKLGLVTVTTAENSTCEVLLYGKMRSAAFPTLTVGAPVYISAATAGAITSTAPTGTTNFVIRKIGFGNTAEDLFFCPDNRYLELA